MALALTSLESPEPKACHTREVIGEVTQVTPRCPLRQETEAKAIGSEVEAENELLAVTTLHGT